MSRISSDSVALDYKALLKAERETFMSAKANATSALTSDSNLVETPKDLIIEDSRKRKSAFDIECLDVEISSYADVSQYKVGPVPDLYYFPDVCTTDGGTQIRSAIELPVQSNKDSGTSRGFEASLQNYKDYLQRKALTPDLWLQVHDRQLQCWGRQVEDDISCCDYNSGVKRPEEEIPRYMTDIGDKIIASILCKVSECSGVDLMEHFDHVLINKYNADGGILHHTDGPRYQPFVAILSLGGPTVMSFRENLSSENIGVKSNKDIFSVVLMPNSLLVFTNEIYSNFLHGITPGRKIDLIGTAGECVNAHLLPRSLNTTMSGFTAGTEIIRNDRISITFRNINST